MMKNLTITITGKSAAGKSKVALEIAQMLVLFGFEVSNEDGDAVRTKRFTAEQWRDWTAVHCPSAAIRTERISFAETMRREEE